MSGAATRRDASPALAAGLARLDELAAAAGIALERDAPIGPLTTLRVGGAADRLVLARDRTTLLVALRLAREAGVPWFVLGNGSDLVVADEGIRGLVVRNRARAIAIEGTDLHADAGTQMATLVRRTVEAGLSGLEFGISIPGTLGGAVWANAGAHGGEMRDLLAAVDIWDPDADAVSTLDVAECRYAYRDSRFKHTGEVILAADLRLRRGDRQGSARMVEAHQALRQATQPLTDQNAGSVFRNPPNDHAGRLIDAAGLKGARIGSASVSTLHANFIVTDRAARAADVRALGDHVKRMVAERFGVELQYEIEFVGEWPAAGEAAP